MLTAFQVNQPIDSFEDVACSLALLGQEDVFVLVTEIVPHEHQNVLLEGGFVVAVLESPEDIDARSLAELAHTYVSFQDTCENTAADYDPAGEDAAVAAMAAELPAEMPARSGAGFAGGTAGIVAGILLVLLILLISLESTNPTEQFSDQPLLFPSPEYTPATRLPAEDSFPVTAHPARPAPAFPPARPESPAASPPPLAPDERDRAWRDSMLLVLAQRVREDSIRRAEAARDLQALRDSARASLDSASIAFNAPERMRRGESVGVHLVLDPAAMPADSLRVMNQVSEPEGPRRYDRVPTGPYAEARLTGGQFDIQAVTLPRQSIGRSTSTEWRWLVTPQKGGTHKLYLTLDVFTPDEREAPVYSYTKSYEIIVRVSTFGALLLWLSSQLGWIVPLLLSAPVAAFLAQRLRRATPKPDGASTPGGTVVHIGSNIPVSSVQVSEEFELIGTEEAPLHPLSVEPESLDEIESGQGG
ncbi:MAG TPA: hypothetical protein VFS20_06210 [Longimicrobium sp.]|nr:hypothetical protein [Longimicrobium sp.]